MRRTTGCRAGLAALLVVLVAGLVFGGLIAGLVWVGDLPLYAPRVVRVEPAPGEPLLPTTSFTLTFDQSMNRETVSQAFAILPAVPGALEWNDASDQVTFVPAGTGFEPGTSYSLRLYREARGAILQRPLARELSRDLTLPPLLVASAPAPNTDGLGAWPELRAEFGYDLDCVGTTQTFFIDPPADGQFDCQGSVLVFRPQQPLAPDTAYQAGLAHTFLAGDPQPRPGVAWSFHTAPGLSVINLLPRPGRLLVDLNEPVRISFNRPVDTAAGTQLSVQSDGGQPVPGQLTWVDEDSVLVFFPDEAWLPGAKYVVSLQGVIDTLGFTLPGPVTEEFGTLPMLKLPQPEPGAENVALDTALAIPFTRPMDRASVEAGLAITPALDAAFGWDGDTLLVTPRAGLAASTHYTLSLAAGVRDTTGAPLGTIHRWDLTTEPFVLEARVPTDAPLFSLGTALTLTFALPMDPLSVRSALAVSPRTPLDLTWSDDGRTLRIEPEGGWLPGVEYEIRLWGEALTSGRQEMGADQAWPFVTAPSEVSLGLGSSVQVLPAAGPRRLQALHRGANGVDWRLYAIDAGQLVQLSDPGQEGSLASRPAQVELSTLGAPLRAWRQAVPMSALDWQPVTVTLPADLPPGFYAVTAGSGSTAGPVPGLLVALTDHLLVVKHAPGWPESAATTVPEATTPPEAAVTTTVTTTLPVTVTAPVTTALAGPEAAAQPTQLLIWDTQGATGAPVVSATVQVLGRDGVLAQGVTGASGLLQLELPAGAAPLLVLSDHQGDVSLAGIDPAWSAEPQQHVGPRLPLYTIATWTDQDVVPPGGTVQLQTLVRAGQTGAYVVPPAGTEVRLALADPQGRVVASQTLTTTALGTASGSLSLPDDGPTGTWQLVTEVAGERVLTPLLVQPASPAGIEVSVRTGQQVCVAGQPVTITVSALDERGEAVAGAPVELSVHRAYTTTGALHFEPAIGSLPGTTGADGRWSAALPSTLLIPADNDQLYALAATVHPTGAAAAASYRLVWVRPAAYYLELLLDRVGYEPGQAITLTARILDPEGLPAAAVPLSITLTGDAGQIVGTAEGTSGQDGLARFSVTLDEQGWYQVRAAVAGTPGRQAHDWASIWVVDPTGLAARRGGTEPVPDGLSLAFDRTRYTAGQEARIAVRAPAAGPALLTVERDGVRLVSPVRLNAGTTVLTLPIEAGYEPNVYVTLTEWGTAPAGDGVSGDPRQDGWLWTASAELPALPETRRLGITLTPEAEIYAPGDVATVRVLVVDAQGAPVSAELSLAATPALLPSAVETAGLFDVFYGPQPNQVATVHSLAPERSLAPDQQPGAKESALPEGEPPLGAGPVLTRTLPATLYWAPALHTDASGQVTITLALPDQPGEWRIVARAVTSSTHVGQAEARLVTTQALAVRPLLPTRLVQGDVLTVTALVHNYQPVPVSATIRLEAAGLAVAGSPSARQQTIHLPAFGVGRAGWQAAAAQVGSAEIVLEATATYRGARLAGRDVARGQVQILPLVLPAVATWTGQVDPAAPEQVLTFTLPAATLDLARIDLFLSPSWAAVARAGAESLAAQPYQDVASAAGGLLALTAGREVAGPAGSQARSIVDSWLQALYNAQNEDGGWGRWTGDATSNLTSTTQALFALTMASAAGESVDSERVTRGMNGLASLPGVTGPDERAWGAYVLLLAGWPTTPTLTLTETQGLTPFAQAAVALNYHAAGQATQAEQILGSLAGAAQQVDDTVYWHGGGLADAPSVPGTALALHAFARLAPGSDLLPGAARWLVTQRVGDGWGDPWTTGLVLLALSDVRAAPGTGAGPQAVQIYVNDILLQTTTLAADTPTRLVLTATQALSPSLVMSGENRLRLVLAGDSVVYYTAHVTAPLDAAAITQPLQAPGVPAIRRAYHLPASDQPLDTVAAGQEVEVHLVLDVAAETWYAVVSDHLPAGLQASGQAAATWLEPGGVSQPLLSAETQDGSTTFYLAHLPPGVHRLTYLARATAGGRFIAPAAVISLPWARGAWSHSGSTRLAVTTVPD